MATSNDVIQTLIERTESGKLEWIPTQEARWNSAVQGCKFSLMTNALDIYDGSKHGWYRLTPSSNKLAPLVEAVETRFPSRYREDAILGTALKCLLNE